ncbi:MAG TPA: cell division protein ZapE [Longimicrobium sp.]|nr:cell division protein ZapE [Longimicrobium sp.]
MPTLPDLLQRIPPRPDAAELLAGFVPPPRFADKRFENYAPDPRHPSQAAALARLRRLADELHAAGGGWSRLRAAFGGRARGSGVYLDGGFGVGKTHLLAAVWHASPGPRAYLSFDELVHTLGLLGVERTREAFRGHRLIAVDEWELDDPGNLRLALAFLRGALADGARVVTTSNTVPDELGRGRFSQKSFAAEIEELAGAFETLRVEGDDYRHRRFEADPGRAYFLDSSALDAASAAAGERGLRVRFGELLAGLGQVHPIRFAALVDEIGALVIEDVRPITELFDGLRWVHFVDKLYDAAVPLAASAEIGLGELFPREWLAGPFGKKFSRCLSRMEEMLGEAGTAFHAEGAEV